MTKVIFRQQAIDDLTSIWHYTIQKWSENQADKYYHSIKLACSMLGENPKLGKAYPEISSKLLGFRSGKHVIFYHQNAAEEIEVIRILHESMDLKKRIDE